MRQVVTNYSEQSDSVTDRHTQNKKSTTITKKNCQNCSQLQRRIVCAFKSIFVHFIFLFLIPTVHHLILLVSMIGHGMLAASKWVEWTLKERKVESKHMKANSAQISSILLLFASI